MDVLYWKKKNIATIYGWMVNLWASLYRAQDILFRQMGVYWSIIMRLESTSPLSIYQLPSIPSQLANGKDLLKWIALARKRLFFSWILSVMNN